MLLDSIQTPADLRRLREADLPALCAELRGELVAACAVAGGHLGGSLGAVELVVSLHRAFDTPHDLLVFDTGHQAYAHKLLTGRREAMARLRQAGGAAGFLDRQESAFDAWGAGHASTGISAAVGLCEAAARRGERRRVVAMVGDGALTGGLAFEGLENVGRRDLILVLNENGMSIAPNVGGVARMLANGPKAFFEALGLTYLGPVDGHDPVALARVLDEAKALRGPVLVHARTQKGKGFALAEADAQTRGHAMGPFDAAGQPLKKAGAPSFTDVFAEALGQHMARDERVVAVTAAMPDGTGLAQVARRFPDRVFDVGIAEAHAVTFAAAMAAGGLRPVVAIYSTFLQRALDSVIHDVCLQNLPVTFAIDRAGLVGGDGATHQGAFDLAYLRAVPNLVLMAPSDENELRSALATALEHPGPLALRFPRGAGPGAVPEPVPRQIPVGESRIAHRAAVQPDATVLALGPSAHDAARAARSLEAEGIHVTVVDARFAKPLDARAILEAAALGPLLTVEHAALAGGFGSAVLELLEAEGRTAKVKRLGFPDRFVPHGNPAAQLAQLGLDAQGIAAAVRALLGRSPGSESRAAQR